VSFLYLLSFLDRSNISNVKNDLMAHIGMEEIQYSRAVSVFYIGYILFEVPANIVLKRVPPAYWCVEKKNFFFFDPDLWRNNNCSFFFVVVANYYRIGSLVVAWGICSTCMIFVNTYADLMILRAFLGVAESGFFPGVIFYLTFWYQRGEQGLRFALFYCSSALAGGFGGLMAYGILQLEALGLVGWQWLFLIEGIPSIAFGILTWFVLPNYPIGSHWLTPAEQDYAQSRLTHLKKVAAGNSSSKMKVLLIYLFICLSLIRPVQYVVMTLKDPKIWGFMSINVCVVTAAYAVSFYLPSIINEFGYDDLTSNLMSSPVWFVGAIAILFNAFHSDAQREWSYHIIVPAFVAVVGFIGVGVCSSPFYQNNGLAYTSMFLVCAGVPPLIPIVLSWMTNSIKGTTRVGTASAMVVSFGNLGGFIGPTVYGTLKTVLNPEDPEEEWKYSYYLAHFVNAGIMFLCILCCLVVKVTIKDDPVDLEAEELTVDDEKAKYAASSINQSA